MTIEELVKVKKSDLKELSQNERILWYLGRGGKLTRVDGLKILGIASTSSRISELIQLGFPIIKEKKKIKSRYGGEVDVIVYSMEREYVKHLA